ncbi:MAG: lipocalin family protein [Chitinophagaceae bacterium]
MNRSLYSLSRFALVLPVMFLFVTACKKSGDSSKTTYEKILGSWQLTSAITTPAVYDWNGDGVKDSDEFKYMPACNKDDYYTFLNTGFYEQNEGATKCSASDPQVTLLAWYLSSDEQTLVADGEDFTIMELNDSQMKLFYSDVYNGTAYSTVAVYKRK